MLRTKPKRCTDCLTNLEEKVINLYHGRVLGQVHKWRQRFHRSKCFKDIYQANKALHMIHFALLP